MRRHNLKCGIQPMPVRRGYIFPMVLFASLSVGLLVLTITQFQSSNRQKYQHLNDYQAAFNIAYAALVEVLADIQSRQWSNRSFKSGPKDISAYLYGGAYNLRVEDHASIEFMFNVKVRVKFKEKSHLFYWRMKYNPNLLDFNNIFIPAHYEEFGDPANEPTDIDSRVDEIMQKRKENQPKVEEIADSLRSANTVKKALKVVGVEAGGLMQGDQTRPGVDEISLPVAELELKGIPELLTDISPDANYVIKDLRFGGDEVELDPDQKLLLNTLADLINDRPNSKIELRGHCTDVAGTPESNLAFSILRAQSVADYLIAAGVAASRIRVKGFGSSQPIASNDTLAGQAKNRRVEFVLNQDP